MIITEQKFRNFVKNNIFTAVFLKEDGSERSMTARLGVKKGVKGTRPEATAKRNATLKATNKIGVFEMTSGEYRTINLNTLLKLTANGITFGKV